MKKRYVGVYDYEKVPGLKTGKGVTQQQFKKDADVNYLVKRFLSGGTMGETIVPRKPIFGDFTNVNFQEMQDKVILVREEFEKLPANLRADFNNDPSELLEFIGNPDNKEKAIELGLLEGEIQNVNVAHKDSNSSDIKPSAVGNPESTSNNAS